MAAKRMLSKEDYARIVKTGAKIEKVSKRWSETTTETGIDQAIVYAVLSAAELTVAKSPEVRDRNRASVSKWLAAAGAKNTSPWTVTR